MQELIEQYGNVVFSDCAQYRYALWRGWQPQRGFVAFVGLNPSTTPAGEDNATIRRCVGFAQSWGYGGIALVNLFAYRADTPVDMLAAPAPVGPSNDGWLQKVAARADLVVGAWGNHGAHQARSKTVRALLAPLHCLKINKSGEPAHPLYQPKTAQPTLLMP